MNNKIKLRPKQLATLTDIANRKNQLNALFQDLNKQEALIVELALEEAGIDYMINNVKIEGEHLTFEKVETKKQAKGKEKKLEPVKD